MKLPELSTMKPVIIILVLAAVAGSVFVVVRNNNNNQPELIEARIGNVEQRVVVSGNVEPADRIKLSFESGGRITLLAYDVGQSVKAGDVLAQLDVADTSASLAQAQADVANAEASLLQLKAALATERAKLSELEAGTRGEELAVKESELGKVRQDLDNLFSQVPGVLITAFAKADDAVRVQAEPMFTGDESTAPALSFTTTAYQAKLDVEQGRYSIGVLLDEWLAEINFISSASSSVELKKALSDAGLYLNDIRSFQDDLSLALNSSVGLSQTTLDTYKANLTTARTNVAAQITAVSSQLQQIASQEQTVSTTEDQLALLVAGSTIQTIEAQVARVAAAEANVSSGEARVAAARASLAGVQVKLNKGTLRAPIDGIITVKEASKGEIITANTSVYTMISNAKYELKAKVPEGDIAKFKVGDKAKAQFDAISGKKFTALVVAVDPAETLIAGVPSYTTTLHLEEESALIRPGLSATIEIDSTQKESVLLIPQRTVARRNGTSYVQVWDKGSLIEREVEIGLTDGFGNVEVISGLNVGEKVVGRL